MEKEYNSEKNPERKYTPRKPGRLKKAAIGIGAGLVLIVGGGYLLYNKILPVAIDYVLDDYFTKKSKTNDVQTKLAEQEDNFANFLNMMASPPLEFKPNFSNLNKEMAKIIEDPYIRKMLEIPGYTSPERSPEEKELLEYGAENRVLIPGNWSYNIDAKALYRRPEENLQLGGDVFDRVTAHNRRRDNDDIFWKHIDASQRRLIPLNGAGLALLGKVDFSKVSLEDLAAIHYSKDPIVGDDDKDMAPGTSIAIKTNEGNYAILYIGGYVPSGKITSDKFPSGGYIHNFHLNCAIITYKTN